KDPRYGKNAPYQGMPEGHLPVCSYLAVPVISRSGEVLGGLFFGHEKPDMFTEAHERIVSGLAGRAAISMDTARLFQAAEQARAQAESSARELARSNSDLERFAFAASHDLQEPLRMVTSYSQLLARKYMGALDGQANEFLGYIQSGTERMASLIKGLLSYSQAVHTDAAPEPVDCAVVLNEVLKNCRALIEEAGAEITASPLPTVVADRSQFTQLFQNLLTNAIKYRAGDRMPRVRVEATGTETGWLFSMADNGIGIAPEHQSRVFVMFKRLHKKEYSGTGIGLALCQRIVEGHGGRIWVESELGAGSTFYFTFPKQRPLQTNGRKVIHQK
ncbi:MAG: ATP-binding protein, partial [Bryobacteraceae bacterium]